jgi:hydroxypyruvate reductase
MLTKEVCEAAFAQAVKACDPEARVRDALARAPVQGSHVLGLAVGKAALAMARGAGPVARGLIVSPFDDGRIAPAGWQVMIGAHPVPDARSEAAALAAIALVESARPEDHLLALISGGASSLIEQPENMSLERFVARIRALMQSGAPIKRINEARIEYSSIKGGKLGARSLAPITTLVVSDVIGDDPTIVGSAPTVRAHSRGDRVEVVARMQLFGEAMAAALGARLLEKPVERLVDYVARQLCAEARTDGTLVAWGEPVVALPTNHGTGGRAQQLALCLARDLAESDNAAFVVGSDGIDGPTRVAGAFVTGETWDAIADAGIDRDRALKLCDSTPALAAVDALVITGPTGINHADVIAIG